MWGITVCDSEDYGEAGRRRVETKEIRCPLPSLWAEHQKTMMTTSQ